MRIASIIRLVLQYSMAVIIAGCQVQNRTTVSAEGMAHCRSKDAMASSLGLSELERKSAFRQCLKSVDAQLQQQRLQGQQNQDLAETSLRKQPALPPSATANEIVKFCSANKDRIEQVVQEYNQITGEVSRLAYSGSAPQRMRELENEQQAAMQKLEELVPAPYRLNIPLFPNATSALSRCDQQEIISLLGK